MLYRTAIEHDLEDLRMLGLASYGRLKTHLTPENWAKMEALIISDQTFPILVACCFSIVCAADNGLLGMAFLVPSGNPTKIYASDTSYIRMVGVHPDAGGRGIAQELTQRCINQARLTGEKKISLHSAEVMYAARHIYEKLGFLKIRLLDAHYGLEYWLYEMDIQ